MADISNSDDVIDFRDVIARIEELTGERADLVAEVEECQGTLGERIVLEKALESWDASEEAEELATLTALAEEAESYAPDWRHGCTLVRDSYFVDYAEEMVKDIGDLPKDIPGYLAIDWEKTAENIKVDYTSVDFDGVEYWIR